MSLFCTLALVGLPAPPAAADAAPELLTTVYSVTDLVGDGDDALGELAERVVAGTDRESWATFGGPGVMRPSAKHAALIVRQTRANHEAVVDVLTGWRRAPKQVHTTLVILELSAGTVLPAPPVGGGPVIVTDGAAFVRSAERDGGRVLSKPTVALLAGQVGTVIAAGDAGRGVACRYRPEVDGDAVRLALAAAFDGADAPAPAGGGVRVPAGSSAVYRFAGTGGMTRVIVATPAVIED